MGAICFFFLVWCVCVCVCFFGGDVWYNALFVFSSGGSVS